MKTLRVTFELDASKFQDENGVSALQFAADYTSSLIFRRVISDMHQALLRLAEYSNSHDILDEVVRSTLKSQIKEIEAAAESAKYELI
jgi:hypothetical protein